jgi:hypothetical protein
VSRVDLTGAALLVGERGISREPDNVSITIDASVSATWIKLRHADEPRTAPSS